MRPHRVVDIDGDKQLLDMLTGPVSPSKKFAQRRDEVMDPLMLAATAASGPDMTRHHYHHDFFPGVQMPQAEGAWDWSKFKGEPPRQKLTYVSRQAPRRIRLQTNTAPVPATLHDPLPEIKRGSKREVIPLLAGVDAPVQVKCMARTRIPTPHGEAFLHIYHNTHDEKEHLAIVVDPAQFNGTSPAPGAPSFIRSRTLDSSWSHDETPEDRIRRGAYVGRLSASSQNPSASIASSSQNNPAASVRIHSECFTGETIGSQRCDCGEQLDEAIRLLFHPKNGGPARGAIIYLRQEGRGIGLLSKIQAYNLQDIGHDTVAANILLGHRADERGYGVAAAMLRDLGLSHGVRLLTNNPDKVKSLELEGVPVVERVPMIPRAWQHEHQPIRPAISQLKPDVELQTKRQKEGKALGVGMIGGDAVSGDDLDKYLRTKVLKMGHLLPLYLGDSDDSD